jgi:hypothetical protein
VNGVMIAILSLCGSMFVMTKVPPVKTRPKIVLETSRALAMYFVLYVIHSFLYLEVISPWSQS